MNDKRLSDSIFDRLNYINDVKKSMILNPNIVSQSIILIEKLFSNQVKKGKLTEEDVESFERLIPSDYSIAYNFVKEENTNALMQRENWYNLASPVEDKQNIFRIR